MAIWKSSAARHYAVPSKGGYMTREPAKRASACGRPPIVFPPLLSSIPTAAARLGLSRASLYEVIAAGELKVAKFGTRTLIAEAELVRFAEAVAAGRYVTGTPTRSKRTSEAAAALRVSSEGLA